MGTILEVKKDLSEIMWEVSSRDKGPDAGMLFYVFKKLKKEGQWGWGRVCQGERRVGKREQGQLSDDLAGTQPAAGQMEPQASPSSSAVFQKWRSEEMLPASLFHHIARPSAQCPFFLLLTQIPFNTHP